MKKNSGKYLKLSIDFDDEYTGELTVEFLNENFSGCGKAYFDLSRLIKDAEKFSKYPLSTKDKICIEGGYWCEHDRTKLQQEHAHISVSPADSIGNLFLKVRTAEPYQGDEYQGIRCFASVDFIISYEQSAQLSKQIICLAKGEVSEVFLAL